jgi:sugar-specific transcriptional regulator TrmB
MNDIFQRLNCSETQAKLYAMLLETGPTIASMLAKRAGVKRVTVYGALEGLVQKGIVETYKKNNVSYYQAADPEVIANLIDLQFEDEKRFNKRMHKTVQELKKKRAKTVEHIIEVKNVLRYYEGEEAVKTLIQETLNLPSKTQYCIGLSGYHSLKISGEWKSYINSRVKKGMKVLSIQADTNEGKNYKKRDNDELRETRLIPADKCPESGELNIIGDHIILYTSEGKETLGVKIVNKKIAQILKKVFELSWEHSEELEASKKKKKS